MQGPRIQKLLSFLQAEPDDAFLNYALATEYNAAGDTAKAAELYQWLVTKHPDYVGTYYHFGKLLQQQGNVTQACDIFRKGMQTAMQQQNSHAYNELQGAYNNAAGLDFEDD